MGLLLWSVHCPVGGMLGRVMSGPPEKGTGGEGSQDLDPSLVRRPGTHPCHGAAITLT